jgi:hypothetical protein
MFNKISKWFYRISTNQVALISTIAFLLFSILVLPGQSVKAAAYSSGVGTPDTALIYSTANLNHMAEVFGEQGRQAYIRARFTFDLAFPIIYAFFLITASSWVLAQVLPADSPWRKLNLLPLAAMLFDLLENICASLVMAAYPAAHPLAALLAVMFTPLKWIFLFSSFILLWIAGCIKLVRSRQERSQVK